MQDAKVIGVNEGWKFCCNSVFVTALYKIPKSGDFANGLLKKFVLF